MAGAVIGSGLALLDVKYLAGTGLSTADCWTFSILRSHASKPVMLAARAKVQVRDRANVLSFAQTA